MNYFKVLDNETTDEQLILEGYIALFGGEDLTGEQFTKSTDFESAYTRRNAILIDWEHGLEPDDVKVQPSRDDILGEIDWLTSRSDDIGILARHALDRRERYVSEFVEPLVRAGLLGSSSEAVPKGIQKTKDGKIAKWPLKRQSLTFNPAEVKLLVGHQLQVIKSLAKTYPALKSLIGEQENAGDDETGDTEPNNSDEVKIMSDETATLEAEIGKLKTQVEGLSELDENVKAILNKLDDMPAPSKAAIVVVEDETDKAVKANPYKLGLFADAVRVATVRPAALSKSHKAILGQNESIPDDGSYLVGTEQVNTIEKKMHDSGVFFNRTPLRTISNGANSVDFYGVSEDSRATGSRFGGVRTYRVGEAQAATASQMKFYKYTVKPNKYMTLVYATDEVLADTALLEQEIMDAAPKDMVFTLDDDMLNSDIAGYPKGILKSDCLVTVAKENGQPAATIQVENIVKMWSRFWARSRANAVWFVNQDTEPQLHLMNATVGTGGQLVYMPAGGISASPYGSIYGRPVIPTEFNATLGTVGDIVLADWSQYKLAAAGSMQVATSIHVEFLTGQTAFRFTSRYNGQPTWKNPLTPYKGTNTLSPFVALATRA